MKDLTIDEFCGVGGGGIKQMGHILCEAADGNEMYRVTSDRSGTFVIMSEWEYNMHHDALRMLIENAKTIPPEWFEKFEPTSNK